MPLTKRDLVTWAELLELVARMTLAAVAALKDDDPVDFEAVKIRLTPEDALRRLQAERERNADSSPASAGSEWQAWERGCHSEAAGRGISLEAKRHREEIPRSARDDKP